MHIWRHFVTITAHRHRVMRNCFRAGIPLNGLLHDLSKYGLIEFREGARFYQGTRSPNAREREVKGYSEAWMHHKGKNRHHYEYWTDFVPEHHRYEPVRMPKRFFAEMLCDRVGASKVYKGSAYTNSSALEYWMKEKEHAVMHPETEQDLEYFLTLLSEQGEDVFFQTLRRFVKEKQR